MLERCVQFFRTLMKNLDIHKQIGGVEAEIRIAENNRRKQESLISKTILKLKGNCTEKYRQNLTQSIQAREKNLKKVKERIKSLKKRKQTLLKILQNRLDKNHKKDLLSITVQKSFNDELKNTDILLKKIKNMDIKFSQLTEVEVETNQYDYDLFISHAFEDKDDFVRPLANRLKSIGLNIWYDEFSLTLGDSLRKSIDHGLSNSQYGLVILSSAFFKKNWTQYELNGLITNEIAGENKVILPIWHKITFDEIKDYSPSLADKIALNTAIFGIDEICEKIYLAIKK